MPKVPTYDNFQTSEAVQPNVQFQAPQGPTPGAIAADQEAKLGQAMSGAGNMLARITVLEQEKADEFRVAEAINKVTQARQRMTFDSTEGFTQLKGSNALEPDESGNGLDYRYGQKLQGEIDSVAKTLGNERQRAAFMQKAGQIKTAFNGDILSHMGRENQVYQVSVVNGLIKTGMQSIEQAGTDMAKVQTGLDSLVSAVNMNPTGKSPQELEAEKIEILTGAHSTVIKSYMDQRDSAGAKAYFEKNKDQMTGKQRDAMRDYIAKVGDAQAGVDAGQEVFREVMGDKPLTAELSYREMDDKLVQRFKDSPERLQAARVELDRQASLWNKQQVEREAGSIEQIYGLRNRGASIGTIKASAAWQSMSEKNKSLMMKQWEDEADARLSKDIRRLQLLQTKQELAAAPTMFQLYTNAETLVAMSDNDIKVLAPTIGMDNSLKLLDRKSKLAASQAALSEGKLDDDSFKSQAQGMGIDISPKTDEEKGALFRMKSQIESNIGLRQQAIKRPLTREERDDEIKRVVMDRVRTPSNWLVFGGNEVSATQISGDKLLNSSVTVNVTNKTPYGSPVTAKQSIKLGSIPTDEFAAFQLELQKRNGGRVPTHQEVAQKWMDWKQAANGTKK